MQHSIHIHKALSHYTPEQLKQVYTDTAVDLEDQVPDTLENLLQFHSKNWTFPNHSNSSVHQAISSEDMISYVELILEPVKN